MAEGSDKGMRGSYASPAYSYARPLERWLRGRGLDPVPVPTASAGSLIESGRAVAGIVPLGSIAKGEGLLTCPGPMVYSEYTTMSVAVFSATHRRLRDCPVVAVTPETRTSVLYLEAVIAEKGLRTRLRRARTASHRGLLREAPCALIIGDEALRALAAGAHVVMDVGEAVYETLGAAPVYAATVAKNECPRGVAEPPWPSPEPGDVAETIRATGLDSGLAWLYHYELLRLDYNPSALYKALKLLEILAERSRWAQPAAARPQAPIAMSG